MIGFVLNNLFLVAMICLQLGGLAQALWQGNYPMAMIMGGIAVANSGTLLMVRP